MCTNKNAIYLVLHAIDRFGHRITDQVRVGEVSINLSLRQGVGVILRQHLRNNAETDRDLMRRFGPYQRANAVTPSSIDRRDPSGSAGMESVIFIFFLPKESG